MKLTLGLLMCHILHPSTFNIFIQPLWNQVSPTEIQAMLDSNLSSSLNQSVWVNTVLHCTS